jgi:hypothetical protein
MRHGTWIGPLLIFVSLFWLGSACEHTWYAVGGATVQGTVVSRAISHGNRGNNHHVAYRFTAPDGETIEARDSVLPGTYARLQQGGPVEIEYIAGFPLLNRVAGDTALPVTMWVLGVGGLLGGVWLRRRGRRAEASGRPPGGGGGRPGRGA